MFTSRRNPVAPLCSRDSKIISHFAIRKVGNEIREDHQVFISDDEKYNVLFVEKCNEILHHHYVKEGLQINCDIEYNDDCSFQFKCIAAFSSLTRRPVKTTHIF